MMLTATFVVVVVIVMMLTATFVVVVVIVVMLTATFVVVVVTVVMSALTFVVVVVMMLMLVNKLSKLVLHRASVFHGGKHILAVKLVPRRGHDDRLFILLAKKCHCRRQLFLAHTARAAEHDGVGMLDLVVVKLAKILHIHAAFGRVGNGDGASQHHRLAKHAAHRAANVRKLAHARGLDEDAVGREALQHLGKRLAEITHQTATDAAAVHLGDLGARLAQKAAVNADLAKFVLDENHLLACTCLLQ